MTKYVADDLALELKKGIRNVTWGLNLNVFPMGAEELREPYLLWRDRAMEIMEGTGAYITPFEYLHVTAASPAPFRCSGHTSWTESEKQDFTSAWIEALNDNCTAKEPTSEWPRRPFQLILNRLELHSSCGIILLDDPTDSVSNIRKCVAKCQNHRALSTDRAKGLFEHSGFKTPSFIHCTVMRLAGDSAAFSPEAVEAKWAKAASVWKSAVVNADRMTLLQERVAYQHFDNSEALLAEFPYSEFL